MLRLSQRSSAPYQPYHIAVASLVHHGHTREVRDILSWDPELAKDPGFVVPAVRLSMNNLSMLQTILPNVSQSNRNLAAYRIGQESYRRTSSKECVDLLFANLDGTGKEMYTQGLEQAKRMKMFNDVLNDALTNPVEFIMRPVRY